MHDFLASYGWLCASFGGLILGAFSATGHKAAFPTLMAFAMSWPLLHAWTFPRRSDSYLAARIAEAVRTSGVGENETLGGAVDDQWATLVGKVDSLETKQELAAAIAKIPGIRGVTNNLETIDRQALDQLMQLAAAQPLGGHLSYAIDARGDVVLSGTLTDAAMSREIEAMARAISGVRNVDNRIAPSRPVPSSPAQE